MYDPNIRHLVLKPFCLSLLLLAFVGQGLASDCPLPLFGAPLHFSNGATTVYTAVADFNNDGNLDVAATAHDARFVGVFIGDGTGNFVRQTFFSAGNFSVPVAAGDFNNDGNQDLAVGSRDGTVWIYPGFGNGNFSSPNRYSDGPGEAYEIAVADFNQDGKLDLAIGHQFAGLAIMIGNGSGGFTLASTYLAGLGPVLVRKTDFNNDGKTDLITTNAQGGNDSILLGDGAGNFSVSTASIQNYGFGLGDFNQDGNVDVVTTHSDGVSIILYLGDGSGGFDAGTSFNSATSNRPVAADFNGDGKLDIAADSGNQMSVVFGDGAGNFGPPSVFSAGNGSGQVAAGDFNNDGKSDLVAPNYHGGDITVWINNGLNTQDTSAPSISSAPNISTYANAPGGANVSYQIVAFDNSGTTPTFDCSIPSNSLFPVGTTGVTCAAVDACGNRSANVSFNVTVTCAPLDFSPLGNIEVNATSAAGALINYANVDGVASVNFSVPHGSTFPIGTTNVDYVVTEYCGNTIPGSFQVHVIDAPPELSLPNSFSVLTASASGKMVSYTATAIDAVSGALPIMCAPASGTVFAIGSTTVNCQATDGAGNTTTGSFVVSIVDCNGCLPPTFSVASTIPAGGSGAYVISGDFNGDGYPDLASSGRADYFNVRPVNIFLNDGGGGFGPPIPAGIDGDGMAAGDFNLDGKLDLAVANLQGVGLLFGDGTGHFPTPTYNSAGGDNFAGDMSLATADFNNDSKPDLILNLAGALSPTVVFLGNGIGLGSANILNGEWMFAEDYRSPVAAADFNGDGKSDFVAINRDGSALNFGDGAGNFSGVGICCGYVHSIAAADFNGDSKSDLVTAGGFLFSDGNTLNRGPEFPTGFQVVRTGDFNLDGKQDVVTERGVIVGDGAGNVAFMQSFTPSTIGDNATDLVVADFDHDTKLDLAILKSDGTISILLNNTYQTAVGPNSTVTVGQTSFTFENVAAGGTTSVTPIDPASVGQVPGGFAVSNSVAYEIATTASFTGAVTLAFKVPGPISEADFNSLAILHNVNGTLVDVTASTPARDYANLTIYATTTSFSPFYLARRGPHIKTLFDQTKAYKSGSTIPVKLQVLNASNGNVSSSSTSLVARDLRRLSNNTTAAVVDSGNANPDYTFRYEPSLGGAGGGYIFNLSTKGLTPGQYVLTFYVGSDRSFFYTVKFEVK